MNKKKVLFMTHSMPIGGIEISLISLFNIIDFERYQVDLLLIEKTGDLLKRIPQSVNIMEINSEEKCFLNHIDYSIKQIIKRQYVKNNIRRIVYCIKHRLLSTFINHDYWDLAKSTITCLPKHYDVAIDYDGFCNRFILDKVIADRKISWNHFNYQYISKDYENDKKYFMRLDNLVSVSELGAECLGRYFPDIKQKISVIHNIVDIKRIKELSHKSIEEEFLCSTNQLKICSMGRLEGQKGIDFAISTAVLLKRKGMNFIWYIVGEGPDRVDLEKLIKENKIENQFVLLGNRLNPYPYIKACDIYVQTSRYEGYCTAVTEAKILCKPIIVVNIQGLQEQIVSGKTGLVVERLPEVVAGTINSMTNNERNFYQDNLKSVDWNREESIIKINKLLDDKKYEL